MGFYDRRCVLTGLSLHGIDATLVPLLRLPDGYRPVALGIAGTYDRYGAIDGIDEDANTALVLSYFLRRLGDGGFVVEDPQPLEDIQDLVFHFERNGLSLAFPDHDFEPVSRLDGAPVDFALIAQPIWDAVTSVPPAASPTVEEWFARLCADAPPARDVYSGRFDEVAGHARQLHAVDEFVAAHGLAWVPPAEPAQRYPDQNDQHYGEDVRAYFDEAMRDYADVPTVRAALDGYARDELPAWLHD